MSMPRNSSIGAIAVDEERLEGMGAQISGMGRARTQAGKHAAAEAAAAAGLGASAVAHVEARGECCRAVGSTG